MYIMWWTIWLFYVCHHTFTNANSWTFPSHSSISGVLSHGQTSFRRFHFMLDQPEKDGENYDYDYENENDKIETTSLSFHLHEYHRTTSGWSRRHNVICKFIKLMIWFHLETYDNLPLFFSLFFRWPKEP